MLFSVNSQQGLRCASAEKLLHDSYKRFTQKYRIQVRLTSVLRETLKYLNPTNVPLP